MHYLEGLDDNLLVVGSVFLDTVYRVFYHETAVPDWMAIATDKSTFVRVG